MKNTILLLLLIFSFSACNDDNSVFETSAEGLEIKFTPVAGGAMMHYTLPSNREIFAMNVRYKDWQGENVLKTCGYSGDSLLLDGFTRAQDVRASITFVNQRNEESASLEYDFSTQDSAPWAFFNDLEIHSSWNGFQVIYKSPGVVTGMAHVFYLGINPVTQKEDTILVSSFPISRGGDTLDFVVQQERAKNTVIVRTEDFQGFRVKQEIYPDIDAFPTEQWKMTDADFILGPSVENTKAKIGKKYLFDGELKGEERLLAKATMEAGDRFGLDVYGTYLAGPEAFEKPIILDMREEKIPAWIRLYCLFPLGITNAVTGGDNPKELGDVWLGSYEDKVPCKLSVYGSNSSNPTSDDWVFLGKLNQKPEATGKKDRWSFLTTQINLAPKDIAELAGKDPIYVDVPFPPTDRSYRYLKIVVHDTFDRSKNPEINLNKENYFTLHELEVFVKKN